MKKITLILVLLVIGVLAFSDGGMGERPGHDGWGPGRMGFRGMGFRGMLGMNPMGMPLMSPEIEKLLRSKGDKTLGSLTVNDIRMLMAKMNEAAMINGYIERSGRMSFIIPGAGQFINKEPLTGTLFLTAHLGVIAGTITGVYFLLPQDLQFGNTDYLNEPIGTIKDRWRSHSLYDYLPSAAVFAGGHVVDLIIRSIASKNAEKIAREKIQSGEVKPRTYFWNRGNAFGFGMHTGKM